jgi:hypothetical protein
VARQESGRRAGQPLQAAWEPPAQPRTRRGFLRTYGWRVYALPILLVLTALVLFQTLGKDGPARASGSGEVDPVVGDSSPGSSAPAATEQGVTPVDLHIPTAELPGGGSYTQGAAGSWHVVPGHGDRVGNGGKLFTYTVEIENGIDPATYGGDEAFAKLIDQTLADPRGWAGTGQVSVQRIDSGTPTMRISLSAPDTVHRPDQCGYQIKYETSCFRRDEQRVLINLARWVRGALAFDGDMITYRQYAINHEVGHAFGNGHVGCGAEGSLAPVMMQQTLGVANNFVAELNKVAGYHEPVAADGKTCKPNAWPNPQAKPSG